MAKNNNTRNIAVLGIAGLGLFLLLKGKQNVEETSGEGSIGGTDPTGSGVGAGGTYLPSEIPIISQEEVQQLFAPRFLEATAKPSEVSNVQDAYKTSGNSSLAGEIALGGLSFIPSKVSQVSEGFFKKVFNVQDDIVKASTSQNPSKVLRSAEQQIAEVGVETGSKVGLKRVTKFGIASIPLIGIPAGIVSDVGIGKEGLIPDFGFLPNVEASGYYAPLVQSNRGGEAVAQSFTANLVGDVVGAGGGVIGTFFSPVGTFAGAVGGQIAGDYGVVSLADKLRQMAGTTPTATITTIEPEFLAGVQQYSETPVILTEFDKTDNFTDAKTKGSQSVTTSVAQIEGEDKKVITAKAFDRTRGLLDKAKDRREAERKAREEAQRKAQEQQAKKSRGGGSSYIKQKGLSKTQNFFANITKSSPNTANKTPFGF